MSTKLDPAIFEAIARARAQGAAIVIFTPDDLGPASVEKVEERMRDVGYAEIREQTPIPECHRIPWSRALRGLK